MRIPRIYTEQALSAGTDLALGGNAAHHAGRVLRMDAGHWLTLFNGDGYDYQAQILEAGRNALQVRITEVLQAATESPLAITLGQVMSRGDRMDYAIQKATELGVTRIQPLSSERCEVKLSGDRERKRVANWQQVAISAAEQCGRAQIPEVAAPLRLGDWLNQCTQGLRLVLHDQGAPLGDDSARPGTVALLIGPEGGLEDHEIDAAQNAGFQPLALGPRIMRTETAPVAALSLCQWLWGDFQQPQKAETA